MMRRSTLPLSLMLAMGLALALQAWPRAVQAARAQAQQPPVQSGAIAQDQGLHRVYVAQPLGSAVFVLSSKDMSLQTVLKVPAKPSAITVDAKRHRVYVASDAAGVVTVLDGRTNRTVQRIAIGGHPAGLSLLDDGHRLLVTDGVSGAIWQVPLLPAPGEPVQVLGIGPASEPAVLLAPPSAAAGQRSLFWAEGFMPHEAIRVYWGIQPLLAVRADDVGIVSATLQVPAGVALGEHLIVLIGQQSTRSESALLKVIHAPSPPKHPVAVPKRGLPPVLQRLLAPRIAIAVPAFAARGPLQKLQDPRSSPSMPVMILEVALLLACIWFLLRLGRRRVRARKARRKGGSPAGAPRLRPQRTSS